MSVMDQSSTIPLVSICIPTYGRVEILRNTLTSILLQGVDATLYEICVADNSPTNETKELIEREFNGYSNLRYGKNPSVGFLNTIEALKMGTGQFLKLHNNYSRFVDGGLSRFVESVNELSSFRPQLFFTDGALRSLALSRFADFDSFMGRLGYWCTWSTSFGMWKDDFDAAIGDHDTAINSMFPHTSLLFACRDKREYVIDDVPYFENQELATKGGYNITKTFCVDFLGMARGLLDGGGLSAPIYRKIRRGLLNEFLVDWHANVHLDRKRYTFDISGTFSHLRIHYALPEIILFYVLLGKELVRRLLVSLAKRLIKRPHGKSVTRRTGDRA